MDRRYYSPGRAPPYRSPARIYSERGRDRSFADDSLPSFAPYPQDQPFINNDYRPSPTRPVSTYPESERQGRDIGVMSALKGLQEKIRKLELERSMAEGNLKSLSSETSRYRNILERKAHTAEATQTAVSRQSQELESQLQAAESRTNLLEKQLDYMRKMVENADHDKQRTLERNDHRGIQQERVSQNDLKAQMNKISELEREHLKLTATQSHAATKIGELEEKLDEERHHRRLLQDKAAEFRAEAESNRILLEAATSPPRAQLPQKPIKKTKKRKVASKKTQPHQKAPVAGAGDPTNHYRINLKEIPFVAGKSTSASHSVGANVQGVLSLMKCHNPKLCSAAGKNGWVKKNNHRNNGRWSLSASSEDDLTELLLQLQDEFGQMSFEHQELTKQIIEASDYRMKQDLERELEHLVSRMEAKGDQITKLKRHQQMIQEKKISKPKHRPRSATISTEVPSSGKVEVTTTVKTSGATSGPVKVRPNSASGQGGHNKLNILKDMRKLQTSLRKDDISWDC